MLVKKDCAKSAESGTDKVAIITKKIKSIFTSNDQSKDKNTASSTSSAFLSRDNVYNENPDLLPHRVDKLINSVSEV